MLAPAFGHAIGQQAAVGGRREPVDGGPHHDHRLVERAVALEGEDPLAGYLRGADGACFEQFQEAAVERSTLREGVEDGARTRVLGLDPGLDLGRVAVLQPAVGIGDLDAVEDVDDMLAPRRWRRWRGRIANGRRSAACRGWPCSYGCGSCACWSSST